MQIEFSAYADDYTAHGEVALEGDRLSDWLGAAHDVDVTDLTLRALDDGREHSLSSAQIPREELCAVAATGPRGRLDRRLRTRVYPMRAVVGPYRIVGYFHAPPTTDPWTVLQRRPIVALSPARIMFEVDGEPVDEALPGILLVHSKVDSLRDANDADIGLSKAIEVPLTPADKRAKDMTGDVR